LEGCEKDIILMGNSRYRNVYYGGAFMSVYETERDRDRDTDRDKRRDNNAFRELRLVQPCWNKVKPNGKLIKR
jgi:hypothetical protein